MLRILGYSQIETFNLKAKITSVRVRSALNKAPYISNVILNLFQDP